MMVVWGTAVCKHYLTGTVLPGVWRCSTWSISTAGLVFFVLLEKVMLSGRACLQTVLPMGLLHDLHPGLCSKADSFPAMAVPASLELSSKSGLWKYCLGRPGHYTVQH